MPATTPDSQKLNWDLFGVIASFSSHDTLRAMSLINRQALAMSRPHLFYTVELDMARMLEYHTLKCDAAEATQKNQATAGEHATEVRFSLPLHHTKVLRLSLECMRSEEIMALSHLVRISGLRPAELIVRGNLLDVRAHTFSQFVLPMLEAFSGVQKLCFCSKAMDWSVDMFFWLAICPQTVLVSTAGSTVASVEPHLDQFYDLQQAGGEAKQHGANALVDVIVNNDLKVANPVPPTRSAGALHLCSFPGQVLNV